VVDRTPVIVGVGLSDAPRAPHLDGIEHHVQALRRALDDCGIAKREIDGYLCAGGSEAHGGIDDAATMAEYLGITHRWLDGTKTGGSSFELYAQHAAVALREGHCDVALMTYGSDMLSRMGRTLGTQMFGGDEPARGPSQWERPYGNTLVSNYAMAAQRHMHEFGTRPEQLAEIAVTMRRHAALNPNAQYRDPISVDDVLGSRMVADPLHKLDCCVISDGGGAIIMTTAERARDLRRPPVYVLGAAMAGSHWNPSQMRDFTTTAAALSGPDAFAQCGLRPGDVDTLQLYDSFTITALLMCEDLGFCNKGEGGDFVASGALALGGAVPTNTDGGGLSSCHPGMRGLFLLAEATRQLRRDAGPAQVANCQVALCCGSGGWLSAMGVVILGSEAP